MGRGPQAGPPPRPPRLQKVFGGGEADRFWSAGPPQVDRVGPGAAGEGGRLGGGRGRGRTTRDHTKGNVQKEAERKPEGQVFKSNDLEKDIDVFKHVPVRYVRSRSFLSFKNLVSGLFI